MKGLLERLVKADPEHFELVWDEDTEIPVGVKRHSNGWRWDAAPTWDLAGWCLEQMQARWRTMGEFAALPSEAVALWKAMRADGYWLTPDSIITAYVEWKEAVKPFEVVPIPYFSDSDSILEDVKE